MLTARNVWIQMVFFWTAEDFIAQHSYQRLIACGGSIRSERRLREQVHGTGFEYDVFKEI